MKRYILILVLGLMWVFSGMAQGAGSHDALFKAANEAYKTGDFARAEMLYRQMMDKGVKSADLYYNLANAHFRQQDFARAILNYERALRLRPEDRDIQYNLKLTNSFIKDDLVPEKKSLLIVWWKQLAGWLAPPAWLTLHVTFFLMFLWLSGRFLIARSPRRKVRGFRGAVLFLSVSLLMLALSIQAHVDLNLSTEAIVTTDRATILSGPGTADKTLGEYHAGTKVQVLQSESGWYEVKASDGHVGWVRSTDVELI